MKTGNIKGTFHPKMGTIKDRNLRDLEAAEEIKKRWKYMKELYKKDLNELDNHNHVVSHPESDILECEVKWALGSTVVNKARWYDGIPVELLKTLKNNAIKVLHSINKSGRPQTPQDWKRSIHIPIPKKDSIEECSNHQTIDLISHASKVMLRVFHARFQHYVNRELLDVQVGFRKDRGTRDQMANICCDHRESKGIPEKNIYLPLFHQLC